MSGKTKSLLARTHALWGSAFPVAFALPCAEFVVHPILVHVFGPKEVSPAIELVAATAALGGVSESIYAWSRGRYSDDQWTAGRSRLAARVILYPIELMFRLGRRRRDAAARG